MSGWIARQLREVSRASGKDGLLKYVYVKIKDDDLFCWHVILFGPPQTPFAGGVYHCTVLFPQNAPLSPPSVRMLTPSGRFEPGAKICFIGTDFHQESHNPTIPMSVTLRALYDMFLETRDITGIGSISGVSNEEKQRLASASLAFNLENRDFAELFADDEGFLQLSVAVKGECDANTSEDTATAASTPVETPIQDGGGAADTIDVASSPSPCVLSLASPDEERDEEPYLDRSGRLVLNARSDEEAIDHGWGCVVCKQMLEDPVTVGPCAHPTCRTCIQSFYNNLRSRGVIRRSQCPQGCPSAPVTREPLQPQSAISVLDSLRVSCGRHRGFGSLVVLRDLKSDEWQRFLSLIPASLIVFSSHDAVDMGNGIVFTREGIRPCSLLVALYPQSAVSIDSDVNRRFLVAERERIQALVSALDAISEHKDARIISKLRGCAVAASPAEIVKHEGDESSCELAPIPACSSKGCGFSLPSWIMKSADENAPSIISAHARVCPFKSTSDDSWQLECVRLLGESQSQSSIMRERLQALLLLASRKMRWERRLYAPPAAGVRFNDFDVRWRGKDERDSNGNVVLHEFSRFIVDPLMCNAVKNIARIELHLAKHAPTTAAASNSAREQSAEQAAAGGNSEGSAGVRCAAVGGDNKQGASGDTVSAASPGRSCVYLLRKYADESSGATTIMRRIFQSISSALAAAEVDDVVLVGVGIFQESIVVPPRVTVAGVARVCSVIEAVADSAVIISPGAIVGNLSVRHQGRETAVMIFGCGTLIQCTVSSEDANSIQVATTQELMPADESMILQRYGESLLATCKAATEGMREADAVDCKHLPDFARWQYLRRFFSPSSSTSPESAAPVDNLHPVDGSLLARDSPPVDVAAKVAHHLPARGNLSSSPSYATIVPNRPSPGRWTSEEEEKTRYTAHSMKSASSTSEECTYPTLTSRSAFSAQSANDGAASNAQSSRERNIARLREIFNLLPAESELHDADRASTKEPLSTIQLALSTLSVIQECTIIGCQGRPSISVLDAARLVIHNSSVHLSSESAGVGMFVAGRAQVLAKRLRIQGQGCGQGITTTKSCAVWLEHSVIAGIGDAVICSGCEARLLKCAIRACASDGVMGQAGSRLQLEDCDISNVRGTACVFVNGGSDLVMNNCAIRSSATSVGLLANADTRCYVAGSRFWNLRRAVETVDSSWIDLSSNMVVSTELAIFMKNSFGLVAYNDVRVASSGCIHLLGCGSVCVRGNRLSGTATIAALSSQLDLVDTIKAQNSAERERRRVEARGAAASTDDLTDILLSGILDDNSDENLEVSEDESMLYDHGRVFFARNSATTTATDGDSSVGNGASKGDGTLTKAVSVVATTAATASSVQVDRSGVAAGETHAAVGATSVSFSALNVAASRILGNEMSSSSPEGVRISAGQSLILCNDISRCKSSGVLIGAANAILAGNSILGNKDFGVQLWNDSKLVAFGNCIDQAGSKPQEVGWLISERGRALLDRSNIVDGIERIAVEAEDFVLRAQDLVPAGKGGSEVGQSVATTRIVGSRDGSEFGGVQDLAAYGASAVKSPPRQTISPQQQQQQQLEQQSKEQKPLHDVASPPGASSSPSAGVSNVAVNRSFSPSAAASRNSFGVPSALSPASPGSFVDPLSAKRAPLTPCSAGPTSCPAEEFGCDFKIAEPDDRRRGAEWALHFATHLANCPLFATKCFRDWMSSSRVRYADLILRNKLSRKRMWQQIHLLSAVTLLSAPTPSPSFLLPEASEEQGSRANGAKGEKSDKLSTSVSESRDTLLKGKQMQLEHSSPHPHRAMESIATSLNPSCEWMRRERVLTREIRRISSTQDLREIVASHDIMSSPLSLDDVEDAVETSVYMATAFLGAEDIKTKQQLTGGVGSVESGHPSVHPNLLEKLPLCFHCVVPRDCKTPAEAVQLAQNAISSASDASKQGDPLTRFALVYLLSGEHVMPDVIPTGIIIRGESQQGSVLVVPPTSASSPVVESGAVLDTLSISYSGVREAVVLRQGATLRYCSVVSPSGGGVLVCDDDETEEPSRISNSALRTLRETEFKQKLQGPTAAQDVQIPPLEAIVCAKRDEFDSVSEYILSANYLSKAWSEKVQELNTGDASSTGEIPSLLHEGGLREAVIDDERQGSRGVSPSSFILARDIARRRARRVPSKLASASLPSEERIRSFLERRARERTGLSTGSAAGPLRAAFSTLLQSRWRFVTLLAILSGCGLYVPFNGIQTSSPACITLVCCVVALLNFRSLSLSRALHRLQGGGGGGEHGVSSTSAVGMLSTDRHVNVEPQGGEENDEEWEAVPQTGEDDGAIPPSCTEITTMTHALRSSVNSNFRAAKDMVASMNLSDVLPLSEKWAVLERCEITCGLAAVTVKGEYARLFSSRCRFTPETNAISLSRGGVAELHSCSITGCKMPAGNVTAGCCLRAVSCDFVQNVGSICLLAEGEGARLELLHSFMTGGGVGGLGKDKATIWSIGNVMTQVRRAFELSVNARLVASRCIINGCADIGIFALARSSLRIEECEIAQVAGVAVVFASQQSAVHIERCIFRNSLPAAGACFQIGTEGVIFDCELNDLRRGVETASGGVVCVDRTLLAECRSFGVLASDPCSSAIIHDSLLFNCKPAVSTTRFASVTLVRNEIAHGCVGGGVSIESGGRAILTFNSLRNVLPAWLSCSAAMSVIGRGNLIGCRHDSNPVSASKEEGQKETVSTAAN